MDSDEAMRVRQGASPATSPDLLQVLARDPSVTVRASLAMNPALPEHVSAILAADTDARVRTILNRRLAALTPSLTGDDRQRMQRDAVANLTAMVADAAQRVRINLAETVKDLPDGPRDIVLRLAHDPEVMVCGPVIRFSPMLTQEDLVTLIATGPPPSTLMAVANRPNIGETVSDAIVGTSDSKAICALLANPTAQIRETTLDSLAAQSEEQTNWQAPLVRRPHLSTRAQRLLAEIVTGSLLEALAARGDLDPKVAQMLRSTLETARPIQPAVPAHAAGPAAALSRAQALKHIGRLDDAAILDALRRNASNEASAMLAVKSGVALDVVERACALRSAKGMVSLAWKAGLQVHTAVVLQAALAQLAPDLVLRSSDEKTFPLSEDEMRWQLNFLTIPERGPRAWVPRRLSE
ncbi:MAG: DUF2336 domain-containing protein [Rhodopila sp.]|jgi:uncharacterized protein (DUF2336 family)